MSKKKMLELAVQQFTGFGIASKGYGVRTLIESMGLTADEFEIIYDYVKSSLNKSDFEEVKAYFESKRKK